MHHHALLWPLGLMLLGYLIGSGRMACWAHGNGNRWQRRMERTQRHEAEGCHGVDAPGVAIEPRAATVPLTSIAPKPCAGSKKSSASLWSSLTVCGMPRTRPNSTSLWPSAAAARRTLDRNRRVSNHPYLRSGCSFVMMGLLGPAIEVGIERDCRRCSRALTGTQEQRLTRTMIEIEAVDQIIGVLVALGQRVKVKPLFDEFQH